MIYTGTTLAQEARRVKITETIGKEYELKFTNVSELTGTVLYVFKKANPEVLAWMAVIDRDGTLLYESYI